MNDSTNTVASQAKHASFYHIFDALSYIMREVHNNNAGFSYICQYLRLM